MTADNSSINLDSVPREHWWDIDGLRLAGLSWGPQDGTPVLALHGWMDHAASFQELAPRLVGCHVVAVDLSGQGFSDHRARHATYNIWDDIPQLVGLVDQLGWNDCVLLGHSRGAIISSLFAAVMPEKVRAVVALDALMAEPRQKSVVETMRAFILQSRKQNARPPRVFEAKADYVARRQEQGNSPSTSEVLAERALEPMPDGFRLRGDARLFASSAVKLTREDTVAIFQSIQCPVLNIWAKDGIRKRWQIADELIRLAGELIPQYDMLELEGDHHFHMDVDVADELSRTILRFMLSNFNTAES